MDGDEATIGRTAPDLRGSPDLRATPGRRAISGLLVMGIGLGVGGFLVRAAIPTADDVLGAAGQDPFDAAGQGAVGLALAALVIVIARGPIERLPSALLLGLAGGVGTRLLLDPVDGFALPAYAWLSAAAALALWSRALDQGDPTHRLRESLTRPPQLAHLGVTLAATGIALQLEGLTRITSRLGLGTAEDDAVFAAVFACLVAIGGIAFGRIVVRARVEHVAAALGAAAVASLLALPIAAAIATPLGFKSLCARFGADASLAGTVRVDMAVALTAFALPALTIGALLHIVRRRSLFVALVFGVATARLASPLLLSMTTAGSLAELSGSGAAGLVTAGVLVAGCGIAAVGASAGARWQQRVALAAGGALVGLGALLPVTFVPVLDPWERFPVAPRIVAETVDGQFTVEPAGGGLERVTLDQRPLSPRVDGLAADADRIQRSLAFVGSQPSEGGIRVLVIGLLTPTRAGTFERGGATLIDRTAGWWRSMEAVEEALFRGAPRPVGSIQDPRRARAKIASGDYDLVVALAPGSHLATGELISAEQPMGDKTVVWLSADRATSHLDWSERVILSSDGIEHWSIGLTAAELPSSDHLAPDHLDDGPHRLRAVGPPDAAPWILDWLAVRPDNRPRRAWHAAATRIASAPDAGPFERAMALHAGAQTISSPFESWAHRIELDENALTLWRDHAVRARSLTGLERGVIEGLARVIEGKRAVPVAFEILEPIAAAHAPWPVLVRTLAWADGEELEFAAAAARLEPLWRSDPSEIATARCYALALVQADRPADAVAILRPLSAAAPLDRALKTQFADALVSAGDPEGRALATELLRDDPGNPLLFGLARGMRGLDTLDSESPPVDGR